ncbi:tyrosine-type recombinase/integrase [Gracilibacillus salitolerans]|uniref:Tyrosine-type recombinase/integrase n=1 Tax=Gracilibacillus salitolerans TaxID=2663022 RepID=A0A5Q2TS00_9BACI|nr:tyrosine-type recombinase/integrase [Gracilibacillus salitolerans]
MASFQKRGKKWQYTISRMVNGKAKPIRKGGFRTRKEAMIAATEVESKLLKGISINVEQVLFSDYFESWLYTYKTNVKMNTLERYKNTLKTIKEYFEGITIQKVTKRSYQQFLNDYAIGRSKVTVRKLNTHVRACVKDAIDEGLIHIDFTRNATITGEASKKSEEKFLNVEESNKLLQELNKQLDRSPTYYLLLLGLTSGMRFGEIVGLQRKDFNFLHNTITINKTWGYTKRMPDGHGPTKTNETRTITMDHNTMQIFKKWFESQPDNIERLVFYSPSSKYKTISNGVANKVLKNTLNKIHANQISVHGLRHTHASVLLYQGVSIYYVSKRLGHTDINTTMNVYTHLVKELEEKSQQVTKEIFESMYV